MNAFIVGRPYQLFNSINLILSKKIEGDLFLYDEYENAKTDYEAVCQAGVFHNVFYVKKFNNPNEGFAKKFCGRLRNVLKPVEYLNDIIIGFYKSEEDFIYEEIYSSGETPVVIALRCINQKIRFNVVEDGLATYDKDGILGGYLSVMNTISRRILSFKWKPVSIHKVYLYRPDMVEEGYQYLTEKLEFSISPDTVEIYQKVFHYINDKYNRKFIVLSEKTDALDMKNKDFKSFVIKALHDANINLDDVCYRLHPAEDRSLYIDVEINVEYPEEMWEILCGDYIMDETVLITTVSTAAFSPKKLYDKEPYVIFLYDALGLYGKQKENTDDFVKDLMDVYRNKDKIKIPQNAEEVVRVLTKLKES